MVERKLDLDTNFIKCTEYSQVTGYPILAVAREPEITWDFSKDANGNFNTDQRYRPTVARSVATANSLTGEAKKDYLRNCVANYSDDNVNTIFNTISTHNKTAMEVAREITEDNAVVLYFDGGADYQFSFSLINEIQYLIARYKPYDCKVVEVYRKVDLR